MLETFEEWSDPDKSNIIIPHHGIILVFIRELEDILEDCHGNKSCQKCRTIRESIPSKLSRPVFSKKVFFSLLYGMCREYSRILPRGYI